MNAAHPIKMFRQIVLFVFLASGVGSFAVAATGKPQPLSTRETDVVGGKKVSTGQSPWQVALVSSTGNPAVSVFCGGTLINSEWVLTAAHCLYEHATCNKIPKQGMFVAYGSTDLGKKVSLIAPNKLIHPKGYSCNSKAFDIALIKLEEPISVVPPVQLASPSTATSLALSGQRLMTTGWGLTSVGGYNSRYLMEVEIPVVSNNQCQNAYSIALPKGVICAGEVGKDACTGDSGGPLYQRQQGNQAIQVGIVSFGDSCGKAKTPGVFTSVAEYLPWINETLDQNKTIQCTPQDISEKLC